MLNYCIFLRLRVIIVFFVLLFIFSCTFEMSEWIAHSASGKVNIKLFYLLLSILFLIIIILFTIISTDGWIIHSCKINYLIMARGSPILWRAGRQYRHDDTYRLDVFLEPRFKNFQVSDFFLYINLTTYLYAKFELSRSSGSGLEFWSIGESVIKMTILGR